MVPPATWRSAHRPLRRGRVRVGKAAPEVATLLRARHGDYAEQAITAAGTVRMGCRWCLLARCRW
jgi:hypothetical protein